MTAFYLDVKSAGVQRRDAKERIVLEEYPTEPPSTVLNGYIYALFGIYEYYKASGDTQARDLLAQCLESLQELLEDYDAGMWSRYDHPSYGYAGWAPVRCHMLHIHQLRVLYEITRNPEFKAIADRWLYYSTRRRNRLAYVVASNFHRAKRIMLRVRRGNV